MQEEESILSDPSSEDSSGGAVQPPPEPRSWLTPPQEKALQQLATGKSIASAARSSGVGRRTIFRWLESDPRFVAAYNAWRKEAVASGRARLLAMADLAINTMHSAILEGDAHIAVQVAKATGMMDAPKPGTTDPSRFYRRKRLRDIKWQQELAKAELDDAFQKRSKEHERHPGHCEYMIDSYIKCRRDALRAESPEDRARRLKEQPQYHRNYDPTTLRLLATLDAEDAAALATADDGGNAADHAPADSAIPSNATNPDDPA